MERLTYRAVLLCLVLAFLVKPLVGFLDPELRVSDVLLAQEAVLGELPGLERGLDPWGKPWGYFKDGCLAGGPYSLGPNGRNERGTSGADIPPAHDPRLPPPPELIAYRWSREILLGLAAWLLATLVLLRLVRARSLPVVVSAGLLAWLPSVPLVTWLAGSWQEHFGGWINRLPFLSVSPGLAAVATANALTLGVIVSFGLARRPTRSARALPRRLRRLGAALALSLGAQLLVAGVEAAEAVDACAPHQLPARLLDTGAPGHESKRTFLLLCASCHSIDGTSGVARSVIGLYGSYVEQRDGSFVYADDAFIRRSILDPSYELTKGFQNQMAGQGFAESLSDEQVERLVEFYRDPEGSLHGRYQAR